jgi:hypothetical protein
LSAKCRGSLVALGLLVAQLGSGTPLQGTLDRLERSVTRPVPQAPPPPPSHPSNVWVPDRIVSDPTTGLQVTVPGHWDSRLPSGQLYGPPTTVCPPTGCVTIPAGPRPDPNQTP